MDNKKQPKIKFDNVIFPDISFQRKPDVEENPEFVVDVGLKQSIKGSRLTYTVDFFVNREIKNPSMKFHCKAVGFFSTSGEGNLSLKKFSELNAPALMFPYIRELMHTLSIRAGLKPIILPPVNLKAMIDKKSKSADKSKNTQTKQIA